MMYKQKDFSLRELRDFNKNLAKQIGDVIHTQPDVIPTTHMLFSQVSVYQKKECKKILGRR